MANLRKLECRADQRSTDIEASPALLDHGAGKLHQERNVYSHRPSTTPKPSRGEMFSEHCAPMELERAWRTKTINIAALWACLWPAAIANSMAVGQGKMNASAWSSRRRNSRSVWSARSLLPPQYCYGGRVLPLSRVQWHREKRERREIEFELKEKSIHPLDEMALAARDILLSRIRRVSRFEAVKTLYERGHTNS